MVREFAQSPSFILRKSFIVFCTKAISVFSFKTFKEYFLEAYIQMHSDKTLEVKLKFLKSVPVIRPYLESDVDLLLQFNEKLDLLTMHDPAKCVIELSQKID